MGVSGSGKTTVGKLFAEQSGWAFIEGDDYHPPENVRKMANGTPLTDADRQPWLENLHKILLEHAQAHQPLVMACSALKKHYRQMLAEGLPDIHFVFLKGNYDLIEERLAARPEHYMKAGMLRSQYETLQEPQKALVIDITQNPREICRQIWHYLGAA